MLGGAGTGKTTFLHELQKDQGNRQVFLAPTGVAALRLRGQTIHSFFGIPPQIVNQDEIEVNVYQRRLFRSLERVVIDEISMVRADLLDVVDRTLRIARDTDAPFGGVQVVLVGDFFQLPPVVPLADEEILDRLGYEGPYSFNAKIFPQLVLNRVPFTIVHRQSDPIFIECLNCLRRGMNIITTLATINDACVGSHRPNRMPVILTPTIRRADIYNREGLSQLQTPAQVYVGTATGTFGSGADKLPAPESLALKVGARVMMVKNDPGLRWVNGSVGTVTGLAEKSVAVRLDAGREVEVAPDTWEKIRYEWDRCSLARCGSRCGKVHAPAARARLGSDNSQSSRSHTGRRACGFRLRSVRPRSGICRGLPLSIARWPFTRAAYPRFRNQD